jgi:ribulose-5-phosphate 4-epimerase/fuculose-1-phosphate aldolase
VNDATSKLLAETVTAYRILVNEVVLDGFGHISVRSPTTPSRFFMPRAMPPSLVEIEDFLELDVETSQPADPKGRRVNGERYLHGEIFKARPDVNAIVHAHSYSTIPLILAGITMQPVMVQAGFMPLNVPTFELRTVRGAGRGLQITDPARGAALAAVLGPHPVALLRGHGVVVVGPSIVHATIYAIYTELNAKLQMQAIQMAPHIEPLDEPELFEASEFDVNRPWQHYRSQLPNFDAGASVDRAQFGLDSTQPRLQQ